MSKVTPGRRVPIREGLDPYSALELAGDYYGPVVGWSGDRPAVFFLLPIARDDGARGGARAMHHVCSPPHTFTENPDGSLSIHASILAGPRDKSYWHGFLESGNWREC